MTICPRCGKPILDGTLGAWQVTRPAVQQTALPVSATWDSIYPDADNRTYAFRFADSLTIYAQPPDTYQFLMLAQLALRQHFATPEAMRRAFNNAVAYGGGGLPTHLPSASYIDSLVPYPRPLGPARSGYASHPFWGWLVHTLFGWNLAL